MAAFCAPAWDPANKWLRRPRALGLMLAEKILVLEDYEIEDLFFGNSPPRKQLEITLMKIIRNIEELNRIPIDKRHYDF